MALWGANPIVFVASATGMSPAVSVIRLPSRPPTTIYGDSKRMGCRRLGIDRAVWYVINRTLVMRVMLTPGLYRTMAHGGKATV